MITSTVFKKDNLDFDLKIVYCIKQQMGWGSSSYNWKITLPTNTNTTNLKHAIIFYNLTKW